MHGCNEQMASRFTVSASVLDYLHYSDAMDEQSIANAKNYMNQLYIQMLRNHFRDDGSYNMWSGYSSRSVWITAYITRIFLRAMNRGVIKEDKRMVKKSLNYLVSIKIQDPSGAISWNSADQGYSKDPYEKNSLNSKAYITAFVLIPFLYYKLKFETDNQFDPIIQGAIKHLDNDYAQLDSLPSAMFAYALATHEGKSKLSKALSILESLETKYAKTFDSKKYFTLITSEKKLQTVGKLDRNNVITSSYVALAYMRKGEYVKAKPIINWLLGVRTIERKFFEHHDTAMAMDAITQFEKKVSRKPTTATVKFETKSHNENITINPQKKEITQYIQMPENDGIKMTYSGSGFLLADVACDSYDILPKNAEFYTIKIKKIHHESFPTIVVDLNYTSSESSTEMVILEFQLQSGFVYPEAKNVYELHSHVRVNIYLFF